MISPNSYFNKIAKIIRSCKTYNHLETARRCIDIFDGHREYNINYFKGSGEIPIISDKNNKYDHDMAVWMLIKTLREKRKTVKL